MSSAKDNEQQALRTALFFGRADVPIEARPCVVSTISTLMVKEAALQRGAEAAAAAAAAVASTTSTSSKKKETSSIRPGFISGAEDDADVFTPFDATAVEMECELPPAQMAVPFPVMKDVVGDSDASSDTGTGGVYAVVPCSVAPDYTMLEPNMPSASGGGGPSTRSGPGSRASSFLAGRFSRRSQTSTPPTPPTAGADVLQRAAGLCSQYSFVKPNLQFTAEASSNQQQSASQTLLSTRQSRRTVYAIPSGRRSALIPLEPFADESTQTSGATALMGRRGNNNEASAMALRLKGCGDLNLGFHARVCDPGAGSVAASSLKALPEGSIAYELRGCSFTNGVLREMVMCEAANLAMETHFGATRRPGGGGMSPTPPSTPPRSTPPTMTSAGSSRVGSAPSSSASAAQSRSKLSTGELPQRLGTPPTLKGSSQLSLSGSTSALHQSSQVAQYVPGMRPVGYWRYRRHDAAVFAALTTVPSTVDDEKKGTEEKEGKPTSIKQPDFEKYMWAAPCCSIFTTTSDKRLESHLFRGLERLLKLVVHGCCRNAPSHLKTLHKEVLGAFPSSRVEGDQVGAETWIQSLMATEMGMYALDAKEQDDCLASNFFNPVAFLVKNNNVRAALIDFMESGEGRGKVKKNASSTLADIGAVKKAVSEALEHPGSGDAKKKEGDGANAHSHTCLDFSTVAAAFATLSQQHSSLSHLHNKVASSTTSPSYPDVVSLFSAIMLLFWQAGAEAGETLRVFHDNGINWGTYDDALGSHCNAHTNNFVVVKEKLDFNPAMVSSTNEEKEINDDEEHQHLTSSVFDPHSQLLAPVDFDMAFYTRDARGNIEESPEKRGAREKGSGTPAPLPPIGDKSEMERNSLAMCIGRALQNTGAEDAEELKIENHDDDGGTKILVDLVQALRDAAVVGYAHGYTGKEGRLHILYDEKKRLSESCSASSVVSGPPRSVPSQMLCELINDSLLMALALSADVSA